MPEKVFFSGHHIALTAQDVKARSNSLVKGIAYRLQPSVFLKNMITLSMIVMLTNHGTFHVRLQCQTNGSHTTTGYITYIT